MYESIIESIRRKKVGIDLFDQPLKAVELKKGIYINETMENFYNKMPPEFKSQKQKDIFSSLKYWGDFEILRQIFKYAYKNLGTNILGSSMIVSLPYDLKEDKLGEVWMRMIIDVAMEQKWREVYIADNYFCAALGVGIPANDVGEDGLTRKNIFIYATSWCTYAGIVFAGSLFHMKIINKNYNEITIDEIKSKIEEIKGELSHRLPEHFKNVHVDENELEKLRLGWKLQMGRKIHLAVPRKKRYEFGSSMEDYQFVYADDYEGCIINGLRTLLSELDNMKRARPVRK
ncbi:acetate and sugar kinases/Hsc70/actin family protein [Anaeromicrobium sediminis]|uniref:Uncharacterized protein n=1 Tax=Anaeromicrobium sediminis TaxID=1478221 RepID=A0A267MLE8_9FIRM|nr:hypothetical protein [Anaeromicrobium sediminis]PAB60434.1 hypothetical protein CCE28_05935 [Anaeromicrobium sediminis]